MVLALAAGIQFRQQRNPLLGKGRHLTYVLPVNPPGWTGRNVALGTTEAEHGAVEKILQFDDVYFREFATAKGTVALYVAYWSPGRIPTQLVASHTPDRCWVESGWKNERAKHAYTLTYGNKSLRPGEWRTFLAPDGQRLNVLFWHLVGTEIHDDGEGLTKVPPVWRWWRAAAWQIFQSPPEQYFIRLTSNRPFEELAGDPGWEELLGALAKLGLSAER